MPSPDMPKFVVNARFLTQPITGVQRHAIEVSRRLKRQVPIVRFLSPASVIHPELAQELGAEQVGRLRGHAWEQLELPRHLNGAGLVSLCNAAPIAVERQIVTIHDAAPFSVPEAYGRVFRTWYRVMIRQLGRRACAIMTDSQFSAGELERCAGIAPAKVSVVSLGCDHVRQIASDEGVLDRYDLRGRPFLLAVGSRSPHKNFTALLRAAERLGNAPFLFVIAGGTSPRIHATGRAGELPAAHIRHVGRVSDEELRALFEHAVGYVHPAYYEGFGLPPVEAMALGCPVLSSNAASLPEVLGDAASYFDPFDDADIAVAIGRFMADDALRADLRVRGLARAATFTWDRCAEQVLHVVRRAFG